MSTDVVQTIIVSIAALAAVALLVRRTFFSSSRDGQPRCANCPSGEGRCVTSCEAKDAAPTLITIRPPK
jgi:hypothetical protein